MKPARHLARGSAAALFLTLLNVAHAAPTPTAKPRVVKPFHIAGKVLTPDGKPAADASVEFAFVDREKHVLLAGQTVKANADGAFDLAITFGRVENWQNLESVIVAASPTGVAVSPTEQAMPEPNNMTMTLNLLPLTQVRARLVDEAGKPLAGVSVSPVSFSQEHDYGQWDRAVSSRWTATTDANGYATLTGLPQGWSMRLDVDDARFARADYHSNIALAKAAQTPDRTLHLVHGGSIAGWVLYGPTRKPAAGFSIQAMQNGDNATGMGNARTDQQGRYQITRVPAGSYTLTLFSNTGQSAVWTATAKTATVSGGGTASGINFSLVHGALLTGLVTDKTTGKPLPFKSILVNGPANPQTSRLAGQTATGPDGRYRFRVPAGAQRVFVAGVGDARPQDITVADGQTKILNFQVAAPVPPKPVAGVVLGPDGKAAAGAEVVALDGDSPDGNKTKTDAQGRFAFNEGLLPTARLLARSGDLATPKATPAGSATTLHLAAGALVSFAGRATDQEGKPLANAKVTLYRWGGNSGASVDSAQTDAQGHYAFGPNFGDAQYSIDVSAPGYGRKSTNAIPAVAGKALEFPTLAAPRADSFVAGTIVDPQGKPVSGAKISDLDVGGIGDAQATSDAQGHFRIDGVPRDKTILQVTAPENRWASIQVSSGQPNDIIKVSSQAENEAEGKRFEKMLAADTTNHGDGTDAHVLLQSAQGRARSEGKQVLLVFHASWCGPCFVLHRFLVDPQVKPIMDAHFVVQDLDIWEHGKNKWENPGGVDIYKQYGGPNSVPFFVVMDASGKKLGDAVHNGDNMGMPTQPDDVQFFLQTLRAASPSLTDAEVATLKAGLLKYATL